MSNITKEVKEEFSPFMFIGKLSILAAGGYILWTNRFRLQRFLESQGISTPWMTGSVSEAVASGAAKVTGSLKNEGKSFTQPNSLSNLAKDVNKAVHN